MYDKIYSVCEIISHEKIIILGKYKGKVKMEKKKLNLFGLKKGKKKRVSGVRRIAFMLIMCMLVSTLASCKKKDDTESTTQAVTFRETQKETDAQKEKKVKRIDLKKYKVKGDKSIFDITKLVSKKNNNKDDKLVAACAMNYSINDSRVIRLLYARSKKGVIKQYIVKEYLIDTNEMSEEKYQFSVKNGGGAGGLKVISLDDMIFCDETNKLIYAPDYVDGAVSYSKVSNGEVFAYNGKPYVFSNSKMGIYSVTSKGKIKYNFGLLKEKYSSARIISSNKLKYIQVEAISPYEYRKIYMDIDPDEDVVNKYTMEKFDEYYEEYGEDRFYELKYDSSNTPNIYLYDKKSNIRIKKSIPKSITKLCTGSKKVSVGNDAVIENNLLFTVSSGNSISKLYLWNLKKGKTKKHMFTAKNPFEFTEKKLTSDKLRQRANAIEDEYGVLIYFGDDATYDYGSYVCDRCDDRGQIEVGLNSLESVLAMYPKGFFSQLDYGNVSGIKIHLTGAIRGAGMPNTVPSGVLAFTGVMGNTQVIVIDITQYMQNTTLAHEITHIIDRKLEYEGYISDSIWNKYNPKGFEYYNEYRDENGGTSFDSITSKYTYVAAYFGEEEMKDVYFYDDYAKTYATEDRARLMEFLMSDDYSQEAFLKCPHVIKKLQVYADIINDCFDTSGWGTTIWEERINSLS